MVTPIDAPEPKSPQEFTVTTDQQIPGKTYDATADFINAAAEQEAAKQVAEEKALEAALREGFQKASTYYAMQGKALTFEEFKEDPQMYHGQIKEQQDAYAAYMEAHKKEIQKDYSNRRAHGDSHITARDGAERDATKAYYGKILQKLVHDEISKLSPETAPLSAEERKEKIDEILKYPHIAEAANKMAEIIEEKYPTVVSRTPVTYGKTQTQATGNIINKAATPNAGQGFDNIKKNINGAKTHIAQTTLAADLIRATADNMNKPVKEAKPSAFARLWKRTKTFFAEKTKAMFTKNNAEKVAPVDWKTSLAEEYGVDKKAVKKAYDAYRSAGDSHIKAKDNVGRDIAKDFYTQELQKQAYTKADEFIARFDSLKDTPMSKISKDHETYKLLKAALGVTKDKDAEFGKMAGMSKETLGEFLQKSSTRTKIAANLMKTPTMKEVVAETAAKIEEKYPTISSHAPVKFGKEHSTPTGSITQAGNMPNAKEGFENMKNNLKGNNTPTNDAYSSALAIELADKVATNLSKTAEVQEYNEKIHAQCVANTRKNNGSLSIDKMHDRNLSHQRRTSVGNTSTRGFGIGRG